ncbi:MAG: Cof-type HAD-IIB family hydrolase [Lachnospiraceae bacterium]|nr:Cof-type HAD-IIB family hydrolase [Lachnospiraceae bacterium]
MNDTGSNRKCILFTDIDDTLLTTAKTVTPENDLAIREAIRRGHRIVICTGRPLAGILPVAKELHLAEPGFYIIAFNGALIYDCGQERAIFRTSVSLKDAKLLIELADRHGLYIQAYQDNRVVFRRECEESAFYLGRIPTGFLIDPDLPDSLREEPEKLLLIELHKPELLDVFRAEAEELTQGRLSMFHSNRMLLECVREGTSKGAAVHWLCNYLGIPIERSVSAGDSENDISMIRAAGIGCAMKNATDACKEAADYITERDCDHSGLAEIIDRFLG